MLSNNQDFKFWKGEDKAMPNKRRFSDKIVAFTLTFFVMLMAALMLWIIFYLTLTPVAESMLKKEEARECLQWKKWSKEAKGVFYLTPWQAKQCDAAGIKIDAPVIGKQEG